MKTTIASVYRHLPWLIFYGLLLLPLISWLAIYDFRPPLTARSVFPLLGVWAWLVMWTHYLFWWLQTKHKNITPRSRYDTVSMWLVLVLLLLHPGLLAWNQYRQFGLTPPESFTSYVATDVEVFVGFGSLALLMFLAYEVIHRLQNAPWVKRWQGWVSLSQAIAMTLVFFHGIMIGETVLYGWMMGLWVTLGIALIPLMFLAVRGSFRQQKTLASAKQSNELS